MLTALTKSEIRKAELNAIDGGVSEIDLIEKAGFALFKSANFVDKKTVVFCGSGKNGADGIALACNLIENDYDVCVVFLFDKICEEEKHFFDIYLKLNGKTINELEIVSKIDSTIADKKSSFIRGVGIKNDGSFSASSGLISQNEFESYKDIALNLYKEASKGIRSDRFDIYPLYISSTDNACQYCPFKDICHVKEIQFNKVQEEEEVDE